MRTTEELERIGLDVCEFDNTCDHCDNPEGTAFAIGYTSDMCGEEVDSYICRKCATKNFDNLKNL